jgi:hypothetical protein
VSWSAQRLYTPPEGLAYASGIVTPALRLFLQRPLGSSQAHVPYPGGHAYSFRVGCPLEHLPFVVRAAELMLGSLSGCGTTRPAFFNSLSLHSGIVTG